MNLKNFMQGFLVLLMLATLHSCIDPASLMKKLSKSREHLRQSYDKISEENFTKSVLLLRRVLLALNFFGLQGYCLGAQFSAAKEKEEDSQIEQYKATMSVFYQLDNDIKRIQGSIDQFKRTPQYTASKVVADQLEEEILEVKKRWTYILDDTTMQDNKKQFLDYYLTQYNNSVLSLFNGLINHKKDNFFVEDYMETAYNQSRGNVLAFYKFAIRMMIDVGLGAVMEGAKDYYLMDHRISIRAKSDVWANRVKILTLKIAEFAKRCIISTKEFSWDIKQKFASSFEKYSETRFISMARNMARDMNNISPHLGFIIWIYEFSEDVDILYALNCNTQLLLEKSSMDYDRIVTMVAYSYLDGQKSSNAERQAMIRKATEGIHLCNQWPDANRPARAILNRIVGNMTAAFVISISLKVFNASPENSKVSMGYGGASCFKDRQISVFAF